MATFHWIRSSHVEAYGPAEAAILDASTAAEAQREIATWPGYEPTPLYALNRLAETCGVASIDYKDEGGRFGLGSFKALGGAYAVRRLADQAKSEAELSEMTVACATDGNHGRSVAWAASVFGLQAVIYIHSEVTEGRKQEIERFGAKVERVTGVYDDAVGQARIDAERFGWTIVSDTSYPGYTDIPSLVMHGYTVMPAEMKRQRERLPTHVFLQCGVGAMPAALCAYYRAVEADAAPRIVVVEPDNAACMLASARAGRIVNLDGDISTVMAGLACGHPSMLAWEILSRGATAFMSLPDVEALRAMRILASDSTGAPPITAGETGAVGLAGFLFANEHVDVRERLGIDCDSRIMVVGTERDTDPRLYERIMALRDEDVAAFCETRAWSITKAEKVDA